MNIPRVLRSTSFRLTLIFMVLFLLYTIFLTLYLGWNARSNYNEGINQSIHSEAMVLREAYLRGQNPLLIHSINRRAQRPNAPLLLLIDKNNQRIAGNIANVKADVFLEKEKFKFQYQRIEDDAYEERKELRKREKKRKEKRFPSNDNDDDYDYEDEPLERPLDSRHDKAHTYSRKKEYDDDQLRFARAEVFKFPDGTQLLIGRDLRGEDDFYESIRRAWGVGFMVMIAMGGISGIYISRRVLSRVDNISQSAQRIMNGRLQERMLVNGSNDEFDRLAINLNDMLDRLEALMQGMKEVSDNIAHDLKTPLTRMRARIENALLSQDENISTTHQNALETALKDADGLLKTFGALLHIARLEAGNTELKFTKIDINALIEELTELYEPAAEEKGAQLISYIPPKSPIYVNGNRELIAQALSNLLDNALKYGIEENGRTESRIEISSQQKDGFYEISLSDNGSGISQEDRERVWERFVRLDKSRSSDGNGLGLSLVKAIIHLHKGKTSLEENHPGLQVKIALPIV